MAEHGHGHSTAAWAAVTILLVGAFLISLAVVVQSLWLAIIGIVLVVVGPIAGKVLSMAGLGQEKPTNPRGTTAVR
jgi:multisubunit Na+/H+ antiporter MnhG subunit